MVLCYSLAGGLVALQGVPQRGNGKLKR